MGSWLVQSCSSSPKADAKDVLQEGILTTLTRRKKYQDWVGSSVLVQHVRTQTQDVVTDRITPGDKVAHRVIR